MSKNVVEVTENIKVEEKVGIKLPDPIYLKTVTKELIKLTAVDEEYYKKEYFNAGSDLSTGSPRRVKTIKLPVSRDGKRLSNNWDLFTYLQQNCGYQRVK